MGRLIDADDAINIFTNRLFETLKTNLPCVTAEENQICLETCYKVAKYEIDNIPTAYDVDKVQEEIKKYFKDNIDNADCEHAWKILDYCKDICEIVRKGGVNE